MLSAFERDLQLIPAPYQEPFRRWLLQGIQPCEDQAMMAVLIGEHTLAAQLDPVCAVVITAFLDYHEAQFDIAHGKLPYVLRWQFWGGHNGRKWH